MQKSFIFFFLGVTVVIRKTGYVLLHLRDSLAERCDDSKHPERHFRVFVYAQHLEDVVHLLLTDVAYTWYGF